MERRSPGELWIGFASPLASVSAAGFEFDFDFSSRADGSKPCRLEAGVTWASPAEASFSLPACFCARVRDLTIYLACFPFPLDFRIEAIETGIEPVGTNQWIRSAKADD